MPSISKALGINYGDRADGTRKNMGFFGELKLPNGDVATEYSVGVELNGKEVEIPSLVPTLSDDELHTMVTDVIPQGKPVPNNIMKKAIAHAKQRISKGVSPFAESSVEGTSISRKLGIK